MDSVRLILALLLAIAVLTRLANRLHTPYPIVLVVAGLVIGFVPGLPPIELAPEIVFLLFLPPLLYWESLQGSWRDFRANIRPILLLAIGLVLTTATVVACTCHFLLGFDWASAFVLGAIVAPTDTVAPLTIATRLGLPHRIIVILSGESLVNDATALVLYRVAVGAVLTGAFSLPHAVMEFVLASLGGIVAGIAVGWAILRIRRNLVDPPVENTISLLSGFGAYLLAEAGHASGVLSTVACGLFLGRFGPTLVQARTRLQAFGMWTALTFIANGILFVLVGLQLGPIWQRAGAGELSALLVAGALVSGVVIASRVLWVFPATYLPGLVVCNICATDPPPPWQMPAVIAWTGIRGSITLATALALPETLPGGEPFPMRDTIIFAAFSVILSTLLIQGFTLPVLIRRLHIKEDATVADEVREAKRHLADAALRYLSEVEGKDGFPADAVAHFQMRHNRRKWLTGIAQDGEEWQQFTNYRQMSRHLLVLQREEIVRLRNKNVVGDDALRKIQYELDLEEEMIS